MNQVSDKVKSFILYSDQYDPVADMSLEQKGMLFDAIFQYQRGEETEFSDAGVKFAFGFFKQTFIRDARKYKEICQKRREAVRKRWDTKECNSIQMNTNVSDVIQTHTNDTDSDSKSVSVSESVSVSNSSNSVSSQNTELSTISNPSAKTTVEPVLKGKKKTLKGKRAVTFERFWTDFAYKKDRAQAIDAWAEIPTLTEALVDTICAAARREAENRQELISGGHRPQYAQGWLNGRRWEDEEPEETCNIIRLRGKRTYA